VALLLCARDDARPSQHLQSKSIRRGLRHPYAHADA
jgi:hypothetical protein